MNGTGLLKQVKGFFAGVGERKRFEREDACVLKVLLSLAAVDGDFSKDEVGRFKDFATACRGYNGESFADLWEKALHSAGYLYLQSTLLSKDELVKAFVRESEEDFVAEISLDTESDRNRAFKRLEAMAMADGEYSEIERSCIEALLKRVKDVRQKELEFRFSRAAVYGEGR